MQTFLPFEDFKESAKVLDWKRLNKQITEASQIRNEISFHTSTKWKNHPAVKMWKGYYPALCEYIRTLCNEWWERGYTSHVVDYEDSKDKYNYEPIQYPYWLGDPLFHSSHRSNLLYKDDFYLKYHWDELNLPYIPYVWPGNYLNWPEKILSTQGYRQVLEGLRRRGLLYLNCSQWPGNFEKENIHLGDLI